MPRERNSLQLQHTSRVNGKTVLFKIEHENWASHTPSQYSSESFMFAFPPQYSVRFVSPSKKAEGRPAVYSQHCYHHSNHYCPLFVYHKLVFNSVSGCLPRRLFSSFGSFLMRLQRSFSTSRLAPPVVVELAHCPCLSCRNICFREAFYRSFQPRLGKRAQWNKDCVKGVLPHKTLQACILYASMRRENVNGQLTAQSTGTRKHTFIVCCCFCFIVFIFVLHGRWCKGRGQFTSNLSETYFVPSRQLEALPQKRSWVFIEK